MLSLNPITPILQRRQPIFLSLHLDIIPIKLHCNMLLQGALKLASCFFGAMICEIGSHRLVDGFVFPVEREL